MIQNSIKIEKKSFVDNNLIPQLEFKITIDKEAVQDWYTLNPSKVDDLDSELLEIIIERFRSFCAQPSK